MAGHFFGVCILLCSAAHSLANPIIVDFTQDFGENGVVNGSFTGEDVDLDGKLIFSDTVTGPDTVTAYSLQFTPGLANSGEITSFTLGITSLRTLDYTIGGDAVVVVSGEGPPLEHFYNCGDEFSCFVGDVDNLYSSGGANIATLLTFNDVPTDYWAYSFIEILAANGITSGCSGDHYCPGDPVTRAQMAVFLERVINGSDFSPATATGNVFLDVAAGDFAASFIEQLASDGITSGCGNNNYCPDAIVSRDQMAVFLLRAKYGSSYSPPPAIGNFSDVVLSHWAVHWIEQLAIEDITAGCGGGNYCPDDVVTRAQMAVFLVRTFDLGIELTKQEAYKRLKDLYDDYNQNVLFPQIVSGGFHVSRPANIDLDADGDLDVITGAFLGEDFQLEEARHGEIYIFRNHQERGFTSEPTGEIGFYRHLVVDDLNGDGLTDAYYGDHGFDHDPFPGGPDYLFLQTSEGGLLNATSTHLPPIIDYAHGVCAADFNSNGAVDIVTHWSGFKMLMNDGSAHFTDEAELRLPLAEISADYIFANNLNEDMPPGSDPSMIWTWCTTMDVDSDSDWDIILGGPNLAGTTTLSGDDVAYKHLILFNDGQGIFAYDSARSRIQSTVVEPDPQEPNVTAMIVDDFNLDGCPDFMAATVNYTTQQDTNFFLNDCSGAFSLFHSETTSVFSADYSSKEDINQDGVTDYLLYSDVPGASRVYFNDQGTITSRLLTADDLYNLSPAAYLILAPQFP